MGRFNWNPGHQKQPSEGKHMLPEWFSKTSGEPSRQALSAMMKEHSVHSPPSSTHKRSRTNTLSSVPSREAKSRSSRSGEHSSRPHSGQSVVAESPVSPQQQDKSPQTFIGKGSRIIRRQTSKLNIASDEPVDHANYSRPRGISRVKSAGHLLNLHHKKESVQLQISKPFDFQHVTHTDQSEYRRLKEADGTELTESFNAMQANQQTHQDVRGIAVADLHTVTTPEAQLSTQALTSPACSIVPSVPAESPKPLPPPKDSLNIPSADPEIRTSRSMDNFSRPTRSSPSLDFDAEMQLFAGDRIANGVETVPVLPTSPVRQFIIQEISSVPPSPHPSTPQLAPSPLLDKPLPQPPTIVHAVSTSDFSTLLMKTSPLPDLPQRDSSGPIQSPDPEAQPAASAADENQNRTSLRHMQSFSGPLTSPQWSKTSSTRASLSDLLSSYTGNTSPTRPAKPEKRISVGLKTIDVDDWENAIDYSWDHALDYDEDDDDLMEMTGPQAMSRSDVLPQKSFTSANAKPTPPVDRRSVLRQHKSEMSLRGLGIDSRYRDSFLMGPSDSSKRESAKLSFQKRVSGSPLSKSSSQESIILSIASSILSTHRSSNSSAGDLTHFPYVEDESVTALPLAASKLNTNGSVSSAETVKTEQKSPAPIESETGEDTVEALPVMSHERGASTSQVSAIHSRRYSITPGIKSAGRQRASTLTGRSRNPSRASYSLFPTAQTTPSVI